ncbi:MAG TPA: MAPEG family protein [Rudaea sp.]|jgi:uncharacterized MAPEG superfamily protein
MTLAEWSLFGAVILYLLTVAPAKALGYRDFDNARPRDPAFYEHPLRARALGAHINGIETFPFFAAAVLLAEFRHAPQGVVDTLALLFLAVRLLFVLAYLGNRPTLRTILWNIGFFLNAWIFFLPAL